MKYIFVILILLSAMGVTWYLKSMRSVMGENIVIDTSVNKKVIVTGNHLTSSSDSVLIIGSMALSKDSGNTILCCGAEAWKEQPIYTKHELDSAYKVGYERGKMDRVQDKPKSGEIPVYNPTYGDDYDSAQIQALERFIADTSHTNRPDSITCGCPCHDGVPGFFHCFTYCCKWYDQPRIVRKK